MAAMKAVGLCVAAALICSVTPRPEMRLAVAIAAGLCVIGFCLDGLREGVGLLNTLCTESGLDSADGEIMIRATGTAMLVEFASQLCRDAGEAALAAKIELAGRVTLLGMAAPLMIELTGQLGALVP